MRGTVEQHSNVYGETFFVTARQLQGSNGEYNGCSLEFTKCVSEKVWKTAKTTFLLCVADAITCSLTPSDYHAAVHIVAATFTLFYLLITFFSLYSESVVTISGLGFQLSSTNWCGYTKTTFVPYTIINDVIINEGITMCRVIFYVAVVVAKDRHHQYPKVEKLLPLFIEFSPRLSCLQTVRHQLRNSCLLEPQ